MKNLFSIEGKTALITGGSRGIGAMIAEGMVENGATVYICSRKKSSCEETAARLSKKGICIAIAADLSSMEGIEGLVAELTKRETKIDILVNNAGAAWAAPIEEFPEIGWDKVMDLNVKYLFFLTQKLIPLLRESGTKDDPARVINIASTAGRRPSNMETVSYQTSKAAVIHLTRYLAKHLVNDNINVNTISPGPFETDMMATFMANDDAKKAIAAGVPRKRIGTAEDAAGISIFLSSRASAYITGANIPMDGGSVDLAN